ncbi:MAG: single-stranded DNA-binding protein [Bacilli bacterium]|nr:single-stranded DNA-binding protein [Bacilli bacterium]
MINSVVLVGRLARDPELRRTNNGTAVTSFTVAVDNFRSANGDKTASFIPCLVWNNAAESVAKYARKGSLVGVEGRLSQRTYENKEGRKVQVIEVVASSVRFLEPKGNSSSKNDEPLFDDMSAPDADDNNNLSSIDTVDDDLPF